MIAPGTIRFAFDPRHIAHNPELADCKRIAKALEQRKVGKDVLRLWLCAAVRFAITLVIVAGGFWTYAIFVTLGNAVVGLL